jgi:hypothetical protein
MGSQLETEFKLPTNLENYFSAWNEGYKLGMRDAYKNEEPANNFLDEKDGFMGGYILGYSNRIEKSQGLDRARSYQSEFINNCKNGVVRYNKAN